MRSGFQVSRKMWFCLALAAWSSGARAAPAPDLIQQITNIVASGRKGNSDYPVKQTVKILSPSKHLSALCPQPVLTLAGNNARLTGNRSIIAQCGVKRQFIQITVQAEGTWWTAAHAIMPGRLILRDDIRPHTGSLEHLPADILLNPLDIIGHVPTRHIAPGKPITKNQIRKQWIIVSGQKVDVIAKGEGFQVHASGKAMMNATENETLRVQTTTGRILTGTALPDGRLLINMND